MFGYSKADRKEDLEKRRALVNILAEEGGVPRADAEQVVDLGHAAAEAAIDTVIRKADLLPNYRNSIITLALKILEANTDAMLEVANLSALAAAGAGGQANLPEPVTGDEAMAAIGTCDCDNCERARDAVRRGASLTALPGGFFVVKERPH